MRSLAFVCCALAVVTCAPAVLSASVAHKHNFPHTDVHVQLVRGEKLQALLFKGAEQLETITFDDLRPGSALQARSDGNVQLRSADERVDFELVFSNADITHIRISRKNIAPSSQPRDCFSLDIGQTHWYAGPEDKHQYWPIEKQTYSNYSYVTKEDRAFGVAERYWLNSRGVFYFVEETTPLFIDQNSRGYENQLCFSATAALPYNPRMERISFVYNVGIGKNARKAHMYAVQNVLGRPTGYPDERMVQYPVWSTWALYKAEVNDSIVREFAQTILDTGFENSQVEIDDDWEDCYGAMTFRKNKFPNTKLLTDDLKKKGFRVTLWIHPFINKNCTAIYNEARARGYLVTNHQNNPDTKWWNSKPNDAVHLDFTKPAVRSWFTQRLRRLQTEDGIDNFKFDAGETSWIPSDPILQGAMDKSPNQLTADYVRTVAQFGPMLEVRSAHRTQDLPIFVRMLDKDTEWGWNNGLVTLITTLLQMNLNGYPYVLPDMIGGNGYNDKPPNKEIFIRWLQANVFMPCLQYSYVPWNFDAETIKLSLKFTQLHTQYAPTIMDRFRLTALTGEPVNLPLWWIAPDDQVAHSIYDEYLLGEDIIAAPVVTEGSTTRDIYLPQGQWQDANTQQIYTGPIWLMEYPAPLDVLPYFERVKSY